MNPQLISDVYNRIRLECNAPKLVLENYEALKLSGAFECIVTEAKRWCDAQANSGVVSDEDAATMAEVIMASLFHLGVAVGGQIAAARCVEIAQSGCDGLCSTAKLAFVGGSDVAELLHGLGLSIRDEIKEELGL
jgi:hypothetical protein